MAMGTSRHLYAPGPVSEASRAALERLRASAGLNSLLAARDLICCIDPGGVRVFNSPAYEALLGDREALPGTRLYEDVHPDDRARLRRCIARIVRTGAPARTEYRLKARDGVPRTLESEGSAIRDADGSVQGVVLLEQDVTAERTTAARLAAGLRRQNALAEISLFVLRQSEPGPVMERATLMVADALDAQHASALELEPDGKSLRILIECGAPASRVGQRVPAARSQSGRALELLQGGGGLKEAPVVVAIEDMAADPDLAEGYRVRALGLSSSLCVVIPAAGRPYGTLIVSWRVPRRFEPEETAFLQAVANVLSAAIGRFRMQAALREGEARYRSLTELTADFYWDTDAEHRVVHIEGNGLRRLGFPTETVIGKPRWDFETPNMTEADWARHRADLEARREFRDLVLARINPAGQTKYVRVSGRPVYAPDGTFLGYRGVGTDVTEEEQAKQASQESEARFRTLWDACADAVVMMDEDSVIRYANAAVTRIFGYEPAQLVGQRVSAIQPEWLRKPHLDGFRRYLRTDAKQVSWHGLQTSGRRSDGSEFPMEISFAELHIGGRRNFVGFIRDITEHVRALEKIAESERIHRAMFDGNPLPLYVYDRETLRILAANEAMARQYGWSREDLVGMSMLELRPPEEQARTETAARGPVEPFMRRVRRHRRRDGEAFEVEVTAYNIHYEGRAARLVSPIDVSERAETERALRESADSLRSLSQRLVSVQEAERRALARELHDRIGQNLTALAINLEILRGGTGGAAPGELERRIRDSVELTEATARMVDNVTAELRPPMLDEYGLAAALRWFAEQQGARTGLRIEVRAPPGGGPAPRPERNLALFRIAQEAVNNVVKHAQASRVEIVLAEGPGGLELSIRDDGLGMGTEAEERTRLRLGVRSMRERAMAIAARVEHGAAPGGGTLVSVRVAP